MYDKYKDWDEVTEQDFDDWYWHTYVPWWHAQSHDAKNTDDQTCDNEGLETDSGRVFHVLMHADTMELSRSNEVGTNPHHEARRSHYRRVWNHMKTFKYEYAASAALTAYKVFNMFFGALDDMEAAHERRVIRHGQLRFYAPHHPAAQEPTPQNTPQKKRVFRAIQKSVDPFLGIPVRRYRRN